MNKVIEKQIGNNIRDIREKNGITQEELSAKLQLRGCDITRSAIAKIEVGQRHLYPDEIILIKEILKTEYNTIFRVNTFTD
ncbi:MAG: helix-turn-helix domain-containing protein [Firmicutes bacterium]|nr:helix-turn-helix domain-containing protein [Bacillota bacterium]